MNLGRDTLVRMCAQIRNNSWRDMGSFVFVISLLVGKSSSYISPTMGSPVIQHILEENAQLHVTCQNGVDVERPPGYRKPWEGIRPIAACSKMPKSPRKHFPASKCPWNGRGNHITNKWNACVDWCKITDIYMIGIFSLESVPSHVMKSGGDWGFTKNALLS